MSRIFADDWRDCLREQYKYVIQQQDRRTEATLTQMLYEVGFSEDELAALRLQATLRTEDMPEDYVPEEVQQHYAGVDVTGPEEPAEEVTVLAADEVPEEEDPALEAATFDEMVAEDAPAEPDALDEDVDDAPDSADDSPDSPQQMSLF